MWARYCRGSLEFRCSICLLCLRTPRPVFVIPSCLALGPLSFYQMSFMPPHSVFVFFAAPNLENLWGSLTLALHPIDSFHSGSPGLRCDL